MRRMSKWMRLSVRWRIPWGIKMSKNFIALQPVDVPDERSSEQPKHLAWYKPLLQRTWHVLRFMFSERYLTREQIGRIVWPRYECARGDWGQFRWIVIHIEPRAFQWSLSINRPQYVALTIHPFFIIIHEHPLASRSSPNAPPAGTPGQSSSVRLIPVLFVFRYWDARYNNSYQSQLDLSQENDPDVPPQHVWRQIGSVSTIKSLSHLIVQVSIDNVTTYLCGWSNCTHPVGFSQKAQVLTHIRSAHLQEKPFQCTTWWIHMYNTST